ncbi:nucleotidyltransferase family protein [Deltaproteobacteria bacterium TL4]
MVNWKRLSLTPEHSIRDAIITIDKGAEQVVLVVSEENHLLGIVTDGDIRRAILKGSSLEDSVTKVMNTSPLTVSIDDNRETILALMRQTEIHQIPVVDHDNHIVGLEVIDELIQVETHPNWVVIMAGGLGSRLRPFTETCPKPLLKVGSKPLLETIIENFIGYGFKKFFLSVNYKAEMIQNYFGEGSRWNVDIQYLHETKRMGTAGALSLLPRLPEHPLIVMNGDVLTKVNFKQLLNFHNEHANAQATMCVRDYDFQVPYGVVQTENHRILHIEEKPIHRFFVNAGVYVLNPTVLNHIPSDVFFDMPTLFEDLMAKKHETIVFPIREYWIDIGEINDFRRADIEFYDVFPQS